MFKSHIEYFDSYEKYNLVKNLMFKSLQKDVRLQHIEKTATPLYGYLTNKTIE